MKIGVLSLLLCLFSISFAQADWGDGISAIRRPAKHKEFKESLALAKKHWSQNRPKKYRYKFQVSCFCPDTSPKMIYVQNRVVYKVIDVNSNQEIDKSRYLDSSVDGIFKQMERYLNRNPYLVEGAFNAVNGSPIFFYVDVDQRIADEEMGFNFSSIETLN